MSRRRFLGRSMGALAAALLPSGCATLGAGGRGAASGPRKRALIIAPQVGIAGAEHSIGVLDPATRRHTTIPCEFLVHVGVGHAGSPERLVMLGNRPGNRSCELDLERLEIRRVFEADAGNHFYGHGVFSADGSLLYTTENAYEDGKGLVVVRDGDTYEALGELDSHGLAPHELLMLDDGTFVVANGGFQLDPRERRPPPFDQVAASLVYLDPSSGKLLQRFELPDRRLGIRHLVHIGGGRVAAGLKQYVDGPHASLLAMGGADTPLEIVPAPAALRPRMRRQVLSLAFHGATGVVAATHPDGDLVTFWEASEQRFAAHVDVAHPKGVTVTPDGRHFLVTSQSGRFTLVETGSLDSISGALGDVAGLNWTHAVTRVL